MVILARVSLLLLPLLGTLSYAIQAEDYPSTCVDACDGIEPDPTDTNYYCDYCICKNKLLGWSNFQPTDNFTDVFTDWVPLGGLCPKGTGVYAVTSSKSNTNSIESIISWSNFAGRQGGRRDIVV
ncbi:hypothetical protein ASPFODRAFT_39207 [Aspergillus luchuensis CBS 106.47]|uniref:Uncharacterized protein n=1 Tax=Aspergillus luchuensis (strain CBS 106.47) TaxID=1137211 RepID=A0A1M3TYX7_ASPLC|nr:hypothetical protein ASPFODRAFT_39207 [Aspergillus luchuensis CBS 106.47]